MAYEDQEPIRTVTVRRKSGGSAGYYPKQSLSARPRRSVKVERLDQPDEPSLLSKLGHIPGVTEAPEAVRGAAERWAQWMTEPRARERAVSYLPEAVREPARTALAYGGGFVGGAAKGAAEFANLTDVLATALPAAKVVKPASALIGARGIGRISEGLGEGSWGQVGLGAFETAMGALGLRKLPSARPVTQPRVTPAEPAVSTLRRPYVPERQPSPFEDYLRRAQAGVEAPPAPARAPRLEPTAPPAEPYTLLGSRPTLVEPTAPPQIAPSVDEVTELENFLRRSRAPVSRARQAELEAIQEATPEEAQRILDEMAQVTAEQPRFELPPQTPRPPVPRVPRPLQGSLFPMGRRAAPRATLTPEPIPKPSPVAEVSTGAEPVPARPVPERPPAEGPTLEPEPPVRGASLERLLAREPVREVPPSQVSLKEEPETLRQLLRREPREPEIAMPEAAVPGKPPTPLPKKAPGVVKAEMQAGRPLTEAELAEGNRLRAQYDEMKAAYGSAPKGSPEKGNLLRAYQEAGKVLRDYGKQLAGEEGFATLPFMLHAGSGAVGALGGREYAKRYDPEHELQWTLLGGAAGLAVPSAVKNPAGYYLSNLISGPLTQERNIVGNVGRTGLDVAVTAVGETGLVGGGYKAGETAALLRGQRAGAARGAGYALEDLLKGPAQRTLRMKTKAAAQGLPTTPFDIPPVELPGGGINPLNWPARTLNAMDSFFREISSGGRTAQLGFNPRGMSTQEIIQNINRHAAAAVFQEDPGKIARAVIDAKKSWGPVGQVMEAVIPFVRTRANLLRQGTVDFSPLGFLRKTAHAKTFEGAEARAKALVGSAVMAYPAYLAATGQISGRGPADKVERANRMESGWRPYSVLIGGKWYSYQAAQPFASALAIIADGFDAYRESKSDDDLAATVSNVGKSMVSAAISQSYFDSVGQLQEAVQSADPQRFLSHLKRTAQNLIPGSSFMRTLTQAQDPIIRNPDSMEEWVKALMPGVSQEVVPKTDRWGRPLERPGTALSRFLNPVVGSSEVSDPVVNEISRLGYRIGKQSGQLTLNPGTRRSQKLDLSRQEEQYLSDFRGSAKYAAIERLLNSPGYGRASDQQRYRRLAQLMSRTEERSSKQLRREFR